MPEKRPKTIFDLDNKCKGNGYSVTYHSLRTDDIKWYKIVNNKTKETAVGSIPFLYDCINEKKREDKS